MIAAFYMCTFMCNYAIQFLALYMERNIDARRKQAKNKRSIHMLALIHICREPDSSFHFAAEMYIA